MPVYDLPSKILCRVINVQLKAEPDMDEVLAQITLLPEQNQDETVEKEPPLPPRCHRPLHLDKWSLSRGLHQYNKS
ncbi:auxin response factor 2 isoform X2 [Arachis hypogaea]|uniref:auxin response factor 2 isoform X2 n=1 Tax=Arachis hypogaea TaxID=3818 RepID=UPI000DED25D8